LIEVETASPIPACDGCTSAKIFLPSTSNPSRESHEIQSSTPNRRSVVPREERLSAMESGETDPLKAM